MINYLDDTTFLRRLDLEERKEQFVKISVLDFKTEAVIAAIEGKSTSGNVNLSNNTSTRRTLSNSIVVDKNGIYRQGSNEKILYSNITEVQNLISLNKKIRAEIGFKNTLRYDSSCYPEIDIVWIPLGTFIIKTASVSKNNSGVNISITAIDKAALINGDAGGTIPAGMVLSEAEVYSADASSRTVEKLLIKDLIKYIIVDLGGEDPNRVIIEDIPDHIRKVMKWIGKENLCLCKDGDSYSYVLKNNAILDTVEQEFSHGQDCGYVVERFYYPGKLECNAGESVAAILDKVKNALGNYEWFYDVYGFFHFKQKDNYINDTKTVTVSDLNELEYYSNANRSKFIYSFDSSNKKLLSSISNAPQFQNIKNDFVVWGTSKTVTGATKPIRYHLAFDTIPEVNPRKDRLCVVYKDYKGLIQADVLKIGKNCFIRSKDDGITKAKNEYYIVNVGYGKYAVEHWDDEINDYRVFSEWELCYLRTDDWRTELYYLGIEDKDKTFAKNYYAAELNAEWPKIYDIKKIKIGTGEYGPIYRGGYKDIPPSEYEYFLDFFSNGGTPVSELNINNIGRRTVIGKDNTANCVFSPSVPNILIVHADGATEDEYKIISKEFPGYEIVNVDESIFNNISIGGTSTSAYEKVKDLIVQHTNYNEAINLTIIPIYYLEPNSRIHIEDTELGIHGDYIINSISLPLSIGTSNLSCTRCIEKII